MATANLACWTQDRRAAKLLASCAALPPVYAECTSRYGNATDRWNEFVGYRVEALAAIRLEIGDELLRAYHERGAEAYEAFGHWCEQPSASHAVASVLDRPYAASSDRRAAHGTSGPPVNSTKRIRKMTDALATSPIQMDRRRDCLLRFLEDRRRTSLASSTVYCRMAEGTFPRCKKLSIRAVYWYESDIDDFNADPLGYRA